MRCPKCHYISFGSVDRCRNCGYEFSLAAAEAGPLDLPIHSGDQPIGPMGDLQLSDRAPAPGPRETAAEGQRPAPAPRLDLPLFSERPPADDAPLISSPSAPRPPLSVRRAPPSISRSRPEPSLTDIGDAEEAAPKQDDAASPGALSVSELREEILRRSARTSRALAAAPAPSAGEREPVVASVFARLAAGLFDVVLLLGIDAAVVYFTLRVLELPVTQIRDVPPVPLAVFLLILNGGYLAIFTAAGGQTIGKMLTGIRVVAQRPEDDQGFDRYTPRVTLGAAVLRAAAYLVSLLPAGLGFAAILLDAEGRALHDRLAETRVVKA